MKPRTATPMATEDGWLDVAPAAARSAWLAFLVGGEEHAVELDRLREIVRWRTPTEVPRVPAFVIGVIAVRGVVMPVMDLRLRLGHAAPAPDASARYLIVAPSGSDERFALLVDEVRAVVALGDDDIEPAPPRLDAAPGATLRALRGIGRVPDEPGRLLQLVDLDRVLRFELETTRSRRARGPA